MERTSIVSNYRPAYTIESLIRIHRVTGQEFPISGDAYLRYQLRGLKARMNEEYRKHAVTYTDTDSMGERPC